jgi:hypothetical protein
VKKYLTAREAYVDFLTGELSECPLDSKGRLLEQYDGNDYSGNPNDWLDRDDEEEDDEFDEGDEIFDPDYHEDYFDVDDDDYDEEDKDSESDYLDRDLWDDEDLDENEDGSEE